MAVKDIKQTGPKALRGVRNPDIYGSGVRNNPNSINTSDPDLIAAQESLARTAAADYRARTGNIGAFIWNDPNHDTIRRAGLNSGLNSLGDSTWDDPVMVNASAGQIQDNRAYRQPWYSKMVNGITKGVLLTGTTFLDSTIGLVTGIAASIANQDSSQLWDNPVSRSLNDFNAWAEKVLPNYYSQAEQEAPWYTNIFSANFIADKFIKNWGFTIGSLFTGGWIAQGVRGIGMAAMKGLANAGRTAKAIRATKIATKIAAGTIGAGVSAWNEGRIEGLNAANEATADMYRNLNAQKEEAIRNLRLQGIREYTPEWNAAMQKIDQAVAASTREIEQRRADVGNRTMLENIPLLMIDNIIQFGRVFTKGFSGAIKASMMNSRLKGGSITRDATGKWIGETTHPKLKILGKTLVNAASEGHEEIAQQGITDANKSYNYLVADNYFRQQFDPQAKKETFDYWNTAMAAIKGTLQRGDTWEQGFIGGLTGMLGVPMRHTEIREGQTVNKWSMEGGFFGARREVNEAQAAETNLAEQLNNFEDKFKNDKNASTRLKRLIAHNYYERQKQKALDKKDKLDYKNAEYQEFLNAVMLYDSVGKINDLKDIISSATEGELSDEDYQDILDSFTDKKSAQESLTTLKEQQQEQEKVINTLEQNLNPEKEPSEEEISQISEAKEELNKINEKISDVQNIINNNIEKNPFVDDSGAPINKEQMQQKLQRRQKDFFSTIDDFINVKAQIETFAGDRLEDDQIGELVWLKMNQRDWVNRFYELGDKLSPILNTIKQSKEDARENIVAQAKSLENDIAELESKGKDNLSKDEKQNLAGLKNQLKMQQEHIDKLNFDITNISMWQRGISSEQKAKIKGTLTTLTGATNLALLSMQSKTDGGKGIYQLAKVLDDSLTSDTIDMDNLREAVYYANDMYRLAGAVNNFANKYRQYVLDPNRIINDKEKVQQAANQQQAEVHRNELADRINWAGNLVDINNALESADMQKAIEDAGGWDKFVNSLSEEQQQKVKDAQEHNKRLTAFLDSIDADKSLNENAKIFIKELIDGWKNLSVPEIVDKLRELKDSGDFDLSFDQWKMERENSTLTANAADSEDNTDGMYNILAAEEKRWLEGLAAQSPEAIAAANQIDKKEQKGEEIGSSSGENAEKNDTVLIPGSVVLPLDKHATHGFVVTSLNSQTGELTAIKVTRDKKGQLKKGEIIKSTISEFNKLINEEDGTYTYSNEGTDQNLKQAQSLIKTEDTEKKKEKEKEKVATGEARASGTSLADEGKSQEETPVSEPQPTIAVTSSEKVKKENGPNSTTISKPDSSNDPNYGFRPYLSERFLNDTSLSLADVYTANRALLPSEIEENERDTYIAYLKGIISLLNRNNSFYYVHARLRPKTKIEIRELTSTEIGDDAIGKSIKEYIKDKPLYGIFTEEGQLLNVLPHENEYEYHTKYIDKEGNIQTSTKTIAEKFSALINLIPKEGKRSLGTVNNLYGGWLPIREKNNSIESLLHLSVDEKADFKIAIVQKGKKLLLSDKTIDPQSILINPDNIIEGQVFVLVSTNKKTYLPALCYSQSIQDSLKEQGLTIDDITPFKSNEIENPDESSPIIQFREAILRHILNNPNDTEELTKIFKKYINLPGLSIKIGTWKGDTFEEKSVNEGGKLSISYIKSDEKRTSINLSITQINESGFTSLIKKFLEDYPDLTFNISALNLQDRTYRRMFLGKTLFTNITHTVSPLGNISFESVNDWFTFTPDKVTENRNSAKAQATTTSKLGRNTKAQIKPKTKEENGSNFDQLKKAPIKKATTEAPPVTRLSNIQETIVQTGPAETLDLSENTGNNNLGALAGISTAISPVNAARNGTATTKRSDNSAKSKTRPRRGKALHLDNSRTNDTEVLAKNETAAIEKVKKMFPQLEERDAIQIVHSLSSILNDNDNPIKVYAVYSKGLITLAENTVKGSIYHEAFHYAVDLLFSPEEKEVFFKEAATKYGTSNKLELEEKAAEEFRYFMNGFTDVSLKGKVLKFFRKLKFMIKNLIGKNTYMDNLFYSMYTGQFSDRTENNLTEEDIEQYQQEHNKYVSQKLAYENLSLEEREMIDKRFSKEEYEALPNEVKEHTLMCAL